ncbi:mediator of RNA polymerase II transcription subunit 1-domain-containing protein [Triangularia verruculosa]|uniref:Mediator of RNA polymerase II transcription subunit 1 n=1 Tax=Triangularia verruculosa TaxID=2587418 RepID=A0AAN7AVY6_9PEZI|nr:mediator of RNA polymerase II transcription subunit 1-domain-containing protein [Triangularia verruculosa]
MATPTPMKHALSQQGKTPSQSQHGAVATPPVSTPFSAAHAASAFSPHGPRSSPQQVKKSPATTLGGHPSVAAVNFDSPSAAAALSALNMGSLDAGLSGFLGKTSEDERAKRLDAMINILSQRKGLVSEAGLERLAKRLGLEVFWDTPVGGETKKSLIIAGAALELSIDFQKDIVQSLSLNFPDSAEIVGKHAAAAGDILLKDLQLEDGQLPLTKSLAGFTDNFERLAMLDKLSQNPGLNLYEAVAGIYESLLRLHHWETQKVREDPAFAGKRDFEIECLTLCTRSGRPTMNSRHRTGLSLDYWKEGRNFKGETPEKTAEVIENRKTWSLLIGCSPLNPESPVSPVRISDKWISVDVERMPLPDELGPVVDWLDPPPTYLPTPEEEKSDPGVLLQAPRLPEAVFQAAFDPPIHISADLWDKIRQLGVGVVDSSPEKLTTFDNLVLPQASGSGSLKSSDQANAEARSIVSQRKILNFPHPNENEEKQITNHLNTLYIYEPVYGKTLTELTFSHPQHLVMMLPHLRQYVFLSILLENSFREDTNTKVTLDAIPATTAFDSAKSTTTSTKTNMDEFSGFMSLDISTNPAADIKQEDVDMAEPPNEEKSTDLRIDVTLTILPVPRLQVVFPFSTEKTANILLEIRENGHVHVEAQNVLDESNMMGRNGRARRVEDIGLVLEAFEDIGKWANFLVTRWAQ